MSLYGKDPRYTWGVLRNAQLVPVHLPDWTLRVYIAADPAPSHLAVPPRIINKLRLLGVDIVRISTGNSMAPRNWRLLAADDERVDYFLVRDADTRLSERESVAVRNWLSTADKGGPQSAVVHCVRDHPRHADQAIVDGLWGGRPRELHRLLRHSITEMVIDAVTNASSSTANRTADVMTSLNKALWSAVSNSSYCHDSVSPCDRWTPLSSRSLLSLPRRGRQYVGQKFNQHHQPLSTDGDRLPSDVVCSWHTSNTVGEDFGLNQTQHTNLSLPTSSYS